MSLRRSLFIILGVSILILSAQEQAPPPSGRARIWFPWMRIPNVRAIVEGLRPTDLLGLKTASRRGRRVRVRARRFEHLKARVGPDGLREMYAPVADPHNRAFVVYPDTPHDDPVQAVSARRRGRAQSIVGPTGLFGVMTRACAQSTSGFGRRTLSTDEQLEIRSGQDRLVTDPPILSSPSSAVLSHEAGRDGWLVSTARPCASRTICSSSAGAWAHVAEPARPRRFGEQVREAGRLCWL
jgi:hypothetical protein